MGLAVEQNLKAWVIYKILYPTKLRKLLEYYERLLLNVIHNQKKIFQYKKGVSIRAKFESA
jgi:hypothetical protein